MKQSKAAFRTIAAAVSILALGTTRVQADLVMNGDFTEGITHIDEGSTGGTPSGWFTENSLDDVFWSETEENVEFHLWADYESGACLALAQVVSLAQGTYILSFDYSLYSEVVLESDYFMVGAHLELEDEMLEAEAANNHGVAEGTPCRVTGQGQLTISTTVDDDVRLMFWLERRGEGSESIATAVYLDNVRLSVVPVPGAAILGVIGLAYSARRLRRRTAD